MESLRSSIVNRPTNAGPAAAVKTVARTTAASSAVRVQTSSLRVSSPSDRAEHEAESTASKVMRMSDVQSPYIARYAGTGVLARRVPLIQRAAASGAAVRDSVASEIEKAKAGGSPLPGGVRRFMEPRFGANFGNVRIHTNARAATLNRQVNARAFAVDNHVFFGQGQFRPESRDGQELIAHELTHTIQQGAVAQGGAVNRSALPTSAIYRSEDTTVTVQSPVQVQRLGVSDALDYFADKANNIPGFRMFTLVLGVNPINMQRAEATPGNLLRAVIEFMPGGNLITRALDSYGIVEKVAGWAAQQIKSIGVTGGAIRDAVMSFVDGLSWSDVFDLSGVWQRAQRIFTGPIEQIKSFVSGLVDGIIKFIKEAILKPIASIVDGKPGYKLLKSLLGKDPVTGDPFPSDTESLISGFMGLIGQDEVYTKMQEAKAIPRASAWFKTAVTEVKAFAGEIPALFRAALETLVLSDIVMPMNAFMKMGAVFGSFAGRFITWAGGTVLKLLEIIFDVVSPGALGYIKRTGSALMGILKNPLPFVGNLVKAAKLGFTNFASNFGTHLKAGLIDWLTGSLPGVYIPKEFSLGELVKFVFSVLGISWENIRGKLVKAVGEPAVKAMELGFDIVMTLVTKGPAAAWEQIKTQLATLRDSVVNGIIDMVIDAVVFKGIPKLISMFIPGAGFISAILSIYDTVMVFVNKISKIIQVVTGFINSIVDIAGGAIGAAASKVESTLAGVLALAINFLAGFAGLGKVADKVMGIINKIRAVIDKALDALITWIVTMAKKLFARAFSKNKDDKRTEAEKKADLGKAIGEAQTLQAKPEIAEDEVRTGLKSIKTKYKMVSLELVVESKDDAEGTEAVHVRGEINPVDESKKSKIQSKNGTITEINIARPSSFKKATKDAVNPKNFDLVKKELDRCHVVSSNDMATHYESTLKGKKWAAAKKLLDGKLKTVTGGQVNGADDKAILAAARQLHKAFFNDCDNLFLGGASENRSLGEKLDPRHPDMTNARKLNAHIKKMIAKYGLTANVAISL